MFSSINKWASFVRFSHTVFALPFALAADDGGRARQSTAGRAGKLSG